MLDNDNEWPFAGYEFCQDTKTVIRQTERQACVMSVFSTKSPFYNNTTVDTQINRYFYYYYYH